MKDIQILAKAKEQYILQQIVSSEPNFTPSPM